MNLIIIYQQSIVNTLIVRKYNLNCFDSNSFICRLRHVPRNKFKVCILGDQQHCDEAKSKGDKLMLYAWVMVI